MPDVTRQRGDALRKTGVWTLALVAACGLVQWAGAQETAAAGEATGSLWGVIARGMEWPAYLILAGSLVTIALIVEHFIYVRLLTIVPPEQVRRARQLIERRDFRACIEKTRKSSTFFAQVMTAALEHARHGFDAMHNAALEKSNELSGRMFRKVEYMNIVGNLGPLLGLLGTVYGMIIAFGDLGQSGGVGGTDAGGLATGISLALVNTMLGLGLAIIGLGFFGVCRNRVDSLTVHATVQALDLLEYFRPTATRLTPTETERPKATAPRPRPIPKPAPPRPAAAPPRPARETGTQQ